MNSLAAALVVVHTLAAAVVTHPVVNLYSSATEDTDVVSQAIFGAAVEVLEEKDGFARVQTADGYSGWIRRDVLHHSKYPEEGKAAYVASLFANVYREPSITRRAPLLTLPLDAVLELAGEHDDRWLAVRLPDGKMAFLQRGDVARERRTMSTPEMLEFSRKFLGLPYLWGGSSTFGYDCSGFTQMLCRRRGVEMPRDAHLQADWKGVTSVERSKLEAGDLLFFGPAEEKITHTGMYLGGGRFIHATAHQQPVVQISDLDDPHWTKLLVAQRRLNPLPHGRGSVTQRDPAEPRP